MQSSKDKKDLIEVEGNLSPFQWELESFFHQRFREQALLQAQCNQLPTVMITQPAAQS